jgi:hypothetical protein
LSSNSIFEKYGTANNKKSFAVLKDHLFFADNSFGIFWFWAWNCKSEVSISAYPELKLARLVMQ